jgi:hypothetical protein
VRELFRIDPKIGPENYKTYQISAPIKTHYRDATCREVDCRAFAAGFRSRIDTSTNLGARQAKYIENVAGRKFTRTVAGPIVTYDFPAGQRCFTAHKVPLEREAFFVVRDGDYRGNPRGTRPVTRRAADWVDDFATHQQNLADQRGRG